MNTIIEYPEIGGIIGAQVGTNVPNISADSAQGTPMDTTSISTNRMHVEKIKEQLDKR